MSAEEHKKEFIGILDSMDNSKGRSENFWNFIEMAYAVLAQKTAPDKEKLEGLESRFNAVFEKYKEEAQWCFPKLLNIAMSVVMNGRCDFLGEIAGDIGVLDKKNAQFFTPYEISKFMAKITLPDIESFIENDDFFTLNDPAAGAGCMIIAAADIMEDHGVKVWDHMSAHVTELNINTYKMLYVQLSLRGIPALVINGNSLSLEEFDRAYTPASLYFVEKHGRMFKENECKQQAYSKKEVIPVINGMQFDLF